MSPNFHLMVYGRYLLVD